MGCRYDINIYQQTSTHISTHISTHTETCIHIYVYVYLYIYIHIHIIIYIYIIYISYVIIFGIPSDGLDDNEPMCFHPQSDRRKLTGIHTGLSWLHWTRCYAGSPPGQGAPGGPETVQDFQDFHVS